ncbi:TPA: hypothetical protein P0E30_003761 [Vibrio harveyi]|nr:hypothetical protein [Vibrio harveyi]
MADTDLDQALLSGNVEDIEALLEGMNLDDDQGILSGEEGGVESGANAETGVDAGAGEDDLKVIDTTSQTTGAADQTASTNEDPAQQPGNSGADEGIEDLVEIDGKYYLPVEPSKAAVASKDGNHTIPFAVLEKARKSASEANSKIQELESQLTENQTAQEKLALYAKQLDAAGITPDKLPNELLNDENALQMLQDELPETAANLLTALVKQAQKATAAPTQKQEPAQQGANDVDSALDAEELAELKGWEEGDQDRWDMALVIDNQLKNNPQFQAMPLQERFAEVQRRVKAAFGDPVEASIQADKIANDQKKQEQGKPPAQDPQQQAAQQNIIPNSPSSLGGSSTDTTEAAHEALLNQDALALEKSLEQMSPEKVEEFLAQAAMGLD